MLIGRITLLPVMSSGCCSTLFLLSCIFLDYSFDHSIIRSFNHSIIQSFNHSIIQSFNHSPSYYLTHSQSICCSLQFFYSSKLLLFQHSLLPFWLHPIRRLQFSSWQSFPLGVLYHPISFTIDHLPSSSHYLSTSSSSSSMSTLLFPLPSLPSFLQLLMLLSLAMFLILPVSPTPSSPPVLWSSQSLLSFIQLSPLAFGTVNIIY